ncbi:MAG: neutral/alkaline non-lysosomal ceramidase N-terminal domain-containing protein [Candidatus Hydrogenedentes bacterium]|nr:neutral/alkaline non-lysosomal ceramidase N-terminal domain-containing protein [Candidatus Hydrogenedentota bacterium]
MPHRTVCRIGLLFAAAIPVFWASGADAFDAGAAKCDMTPPVGTPLNGYGDRMGRDSIGVHDPLWARCVYLSDDTTSVFLVTTDLCYIPRALRDRVLELAPEVVPREHIILTATHTHNGPGAMEERIVFRFVSGRYIPEVLEATARAIVQAMNDAYNARRRAGVAYGTGKQTALSENRRIPKGPIDEQIGVIRVDDSDGNPIAMIANFAAHPTTVPETDHYHFSCDYPGFYYAEMERLTNPDCIALFLNGAEGDQKTSNPESREGWERTESIGRLLAVRAKEIANPLICGEATLQVGQREAALPPTLASAFQPKEVFLQTLEINDLLLTFFPGEPCVEVGLELRRRALERGYKAQFSVGLANDYLNYFVPRATYHRFDYECGMNFFGPGIEDWFYLEFSRLMTRGEPEPGGEQPEPVELKELNGAKYVVLSGSYESMGAQRGTAFQGAYMDRFDRFIAQPVTAGKLAPGAGLGVWTPGFLDTTPLALTVLGVRARTLLSGLSPGTFAEVEGIARGVGLPFDAVWLLQHAAYLEAWSSAPEFLETPFCTMFAATGDRAGADSLLVGRNFDWPANEAPVVVEMRPEEGRHFVNIGFAWNTGVYTGMNDAGVVIAIERMPLLGTSSYEGVAVEMLARDVLAAATEFDTALEMLREAKHIRGFHVLLAGPTASAPAAAVLEYGEDVKVRGPEDGILMGVPPEAGAADDAARTRYSRVRDLTGQERIIGRTELEEVLSDMAVSETGLARIWNDQTRHSVIFEPLRRRLHVAFPDTGGARGRYVTMTLDENRVYE